MLITPSSIPPAPSGDNDGVPGADLAERVLSGPGLWLDWLGELQRESLLEELLAEGVIARALEEAPHRHAHDRTLTGKMTVICVLVACLFPGAGYDTVLAAAFGLPGLNLKPGTGVPTGPAFSKARELPGEQVMKRLFVRVGYRRLEANGPGGRGRPPWPAGGRCEPGLIRPAVRHPEDVPGNGALCGPVGQVIAGLPFDPITPIIRRRLGHGITELGQLVRRAQLSGWVERYTPGPWQVSGGTTCAASQPNLIRNAL